MKKILRKNNKKWIIGLLCLTSILQAANSSTVQAAKDVTPPFVRFTITGATENNGINYVSDTEVEVEVYAYDDTCAASEIEYYISDEPIDNTKPLDDGLWQKYQVGLKKNFTFDDLTATNTIYGVFRDTSGNTTMIYEGTDVEYTINYHTNTGEADDIMMTATGIHGMAYITTNKVPTREGYYFLGWGTKADDTTGSYEQGDIITADAFMGSDKVIDLYAIWTTNVSELTLLSSKVKVGDYVNYPLEYENVNGAKRKGWRVISVDVDLEGNETEETKGIVNLISAGIPLTYYHASVSETSEKALRENFLTTEFDDVTVNYKYIKNGLGQYATLTEAFTNKFTRMDGTAPIVRSLIQEDVLRVTGGTKMEDLTNPKYEALWNIGGSYWVASANTASYLSNVGSNGNVGRISSSEYGVRPVISLKSTVRTSGKDSMDRWTLLINE